MTEAEGRVIAAALDDRAWVIHHNDLDGRCSAAIVRRAYEEGTTIFIEVDYANYNDRIPYDSIRLRDNVVIVDFALKPRDMERLIATGAHIVWIDHHATAAEYPYLDIQGLRDFADKSAAGCELTWRYFFGDKKMPRVVELIGDYDKWLLKYGENSFDCYEGMKMMPSEPLSDFWSKLFAEGEQELPMILMIGATARKYRDNYCKRICDTYGYEIKLPLLPTRTEIVEVEMVRAWVTNIYGFGSQGFVERFKEYDVCVAYIHDGKKYTVSLYSEKVDVSGIAKMFGGGGHKGAAGFVCEHLPWTGDSILAV
jgi:oligoribonuclease NrnB/cAMP/cGMP phosphodiesterase (DHH superfamily)